MAINSLTAHFVYAVCSLHQRSVCRMQFGSFSGPLSVISLGTPGTKRLQVESYASSYQLETVLSSHNGLPGEASAIPYTSEGSLVTRD